MRFRSQSAADDGFEKSVAEKMPKVKREERIPSPEEELQPYKGDRQEVGTEATAFQREPDRERVAEAAPGTKPKAPLDVSILIEDLHNQLLILGKAKRALEIDLASDRRKISQLLQENQELRSQAEGLNRELQRLKEVEKEVLYLRDENSDALERIRELQQETRDLRASLESAIQQRDEVLSRFHELENEREEKELLRIKGKLKEREASHFAEENRELRARLEEALSENVDLERKYEEVKRSFHEIRESLTLLRDSCKTSLYSLPDALQ